MQSADKDEILNTFVSMTQCSNAEAARYLEAAQWNAETALEIFFESTGFDTNEPIPSTNTAFPVSNINSSVSSLYFFKSSSSCYQKLFCFVFVLYRAYSNDWSKRL